MQPHELSAEQRKKIGDIVRQESLILGLSCTIAFISGAAVILLLSMLFNVCFMPAGFHSHFGADGEHSHTHEYYPRLR